MARKPIPAGQTEDAPPWLVAVRAAESKQALDVRVLDLRQATSFTDYFVICSGGNQRQIQAIADEIQRQLKLCGEKPNSLEGFDNAEWILADYGDFLVHVFSQPARAFYDLERLWRHASEVTIPSA